MTDGTTADERTGAPLQDERTVSPQVRDDDPVLRPRTLDEFIGQDGLRRNLRIYLEAARKRQEPIDHIFFSGPPGLGKTTLAHIVANEIRRESWRERA